MTSFALDGVVTDLAGKPLAGVSIAYASAPVSMPEVALLSDANGSFRVALPVAGSYELSFHLDGFRSTQVRLIAPRPPSALRVVMHPA